MGVVDIVAPLRHGGANSGKICFIEPQGVLDTRDLPDAPSSGMPRESQAMFRDRTVCGLYKGPVGTGPGGQYSGKNRFIEKP